MTGALTGVMASLLEQIVDVRARETLGAAVAEPLDRHDSPAAAVAHGAESPARAGALCEGAPARAHCPPDEVAA